jgi:hypothetical protein
MAPHGDIRAVLAELYPKMRQRLAHGDKVLVHQEELGDRLQGVLAGYLVFSGLVPASAEAISVIERINQRQMGPVGREVVAEAAAIAP